MAGKTLLKATGLFKSFPVGEGTIEVLKGIDFSINAGDFLIIFGPSGCGKSTLLHCMLGLEGPTKGKILAEGSDFYAKSEDERAIYRKRKVGMIYQQPLWVKSLNVFDNVAFPLRLLNWDEAKVERRVKEVLKIVNMQDWQTHLPTELSSGQQQKISLVRSLTVEPAFIAADEPTGNLDTSSGTELMNTFLELNKKGTTIVMITHDLEYLKYATKIIHMVDGKIVETQEQKRKKIISSKLGGKKTIDGKSDSNVRDEHFLEKLKTEKVKTKEIKPKETKTEKIKTKEVKTKEVETKEIKAKEIETKEMETKEVETKEK